MKNATLLFADAPALNFMKVKNLAVFRFLKMQLIHGTKIKSMKN
ncbi:hypothetical protein [Lacticaseibacillus rhamnosus]|nr:hypothetical protein [Lacticaseibacillus rhamnosus]